jgi:hypothetical protein
MGGIEDFLYFFPVKYSTDSTSVLVLLIESGILVVRNLVFFILTVVWPLYQSFSRDFYPLWSHSDSLRSLDALLRDILCVKHFRKFLVLQSHVQNLMCWMELELLMDDFDFKQQNDSKELRSEISRLWDKYFSSVDADDSAKPKSRVPAMTMLVALPSELRYRTHAEIFEQDKVIDGLRSLQQYLFELMNIDYFKFLGSEYCRDCLNDLEFEESLKTALENSNMV